MSTIRTDTLESTTGTQSITQTTLYSGTAKVWSTLDGSGTIAEKDSYNISGYVDNGTGDYTFTISSDMANANYSEQAHSKADSGIHTTYTAGSPTAGAAGFWVVNTITQVQVDSSRVKMTAHGDLA